MLSNLRIRSLFAIVLTMSMLAVACGGGSTGDASGTADAINDDSVGAGEEQIDEGTGVDTEATGDDLVTEDPNAAVAGGTLRFGFESDPADLNPAASPFAAGADLMGAAIFDTLTVWNSDDQWVDNMSESWTPNAEFTSWDMTLHDGILFQDGTPLNADAVLRNLEEQSKSALLSLFYGSLFDPDVPYERVDDLTVRINTNGSNSLLPAYFTTQLGMMASPAWFDALSADPALAQAPVGAGPFALESRQQDSQTTLVKNQNWWRSGQSEVLLDAIQFFPLQQESTRSDQLFAGDLDVIHATDVTSINRLRADESIRRVESSDEDFFLIFNARVAPFDDLRVRQAATAAFPRAVYTDFINQGVTVPADTLFPPNSRWHDPSIVQNTEDPDTAAALVAEYCADVPASCTDGRIDVEFQYNGPSLTLDEIFRIINDGWSAFFNVTPQVIPQDEHINEVTLGLFDVATWRYHGFLDPGLEEFFFGCSTIGALSINFARNCNETRDELLVQQRTTDDEAERVEIWRQIQNDLNEQRQYLVISHNIWIIGASENVNGLCDATTPSGESIRCNLRGAARFTDAWIG